MKRRSGGLTIMFLPEEGGESRRLRLSSRVLKIVIVGGLMGTLTILTMAASWWFFALEASKGWQLEALVDSLQDERVRILALAQQLEEVEAGYDHIRSLFDSSADPVAPDLWLPPTGLPGSRNVEDLQPSEEHLPTSWPLTEAGFVTQSLIEGGGTEDHPGLDIAIPTDSYVRAAGAGRVLRTGEDPIYGFFLVLEHGNGYQTVYAHNSSILVAQGQVVRRREVVALSGSSGRSTAPHLHFEILLDGLPVDPVSMVEQPG
jgi:murein DD-endopeptidase MepM/ murein hydrolase activator NlpD